MFPWNLFPFNKEMKNNFQDFKKMKPEEINKYVHNIMGNVFPQQSNGMPNFNDIFGGLNPENAESKNNQTSAKLNASVFDTHDDVYVKVFIEDKGWLHQMKLYHTSNQMIIEAIPAYEDKTTITLPAAVKRKGSKANYQDGILEIKLPKNAEAQFTEIEFTKHE
ncbi:Hsp20/alpha crystallin family protein [Cytobacillus gottheilii]|uniref:Hsp20/alpha crystallin family protein n=2 Tax=Cytobacillus gottheilii TaxID=859144 RepID=UPI00082A3FA3|nr:spore coat protein [Cytobacillus gottheilii]